MNRRGFLTTLAGGATLLLAGCVYGPGEGYGLPPHAPAHGYRAQHRRARLVFDSGLGVYIVSGYPDYYFLDGTYYRYYGGHWQAGGDLDGPWHQAGDRRLPPGLRRKAVPPPGYKGRGRGKS